MTDFYVDLLMAFQAIATLVLAVEVHSRKKAAPSSIQEHKDYTSFNVPQAASEPKKSELQEQYAHFLGEKEPVSLKVPEATAILVVPKQDALPAEPVEKGVSSEVEKPKKPFSMEDIVNAA